MIAGKSSLEKIFFSNPFFLARGRRFRQDFSPVRTQEPFASSKTCTAIDFFLAEGMEKVKK